ncbi:MAG: gephyrin-like molybdotransferase Glp [Actinomycetota bacterium]
MIPLSEAQEYVLGQCHPLPSATFDAQQALGLVTAEPIVSTELVPPFDNTAVDGFAVRAADTDGAPVVLLVAGTIAAGEPPHTPVEPGTAVRIMTGAPMPDGADAVVMVENTESATDQPVDATDQVRVTASVGSGAAVRAAGEDMQPDQTVFAAGTLLQPGHVGVLATLGITQIEAHRRPVVGVMSTGDELVDGPEALQPGQIRDSNRRTLLSLLAQAGCEPLDLGLIRDDEAAVEAGLRSGVEQCDALITSGGVSMGDFDFVKMVLRRIADMRWMQVAIKPAKPLAFGTLDGIPVFGLPGNPVSSMVSFELFARPGLRIMQGLAPDAAHRPLIRGTAASPLRRSPDGKTHFARVEVDWADGAVSFRSAGGQGSHQLSAMATAQALALLPDGDGVEVGDSADLMLLHQF